MLTSAPPLTAKLLAELDRYANGSTIGEQELCDPNENPHAAAYFITRFCKTLDEERGGEIAPIRDWPFVLETIDWLEGLRIDQMNGLLDKSRRMLGTWLACAHLLWRSQWTKGFPAFMTTGKGGDYVDDGGDHSTPKSLFGRVRFMWDRLPDHVKKPTDFAFKRIVCEETDAYISGEAPTEQGGRAGGYVHALVDESAFVEHSESMHRALDPACKRGRLYVTTPNGSSNASARIIKTRPEGWRIHTLDWSEHPELAVGLGPTPEAEIDRYGPQVSPRFREITASLRDDDIQQEYNHSLERSMRGLVFKEFNVRRHVPDNAIGFDPAFELRAGVDYGATGFGAAVIGQIVGPWSLRVIADYELEGAGGAKEHAKNLAHVLRSQLGYQGELSEVQLVGGPDTNTTQTGSGQTVGGYYRVAGFTRIRESRVRGPGSVDRGITVVCTSLREDRILISPACQNLVNRFSEYRWPVERGTGLVRATSPVHNEASHIMDAFRYLVTDCFSNEFVGAPPRTKMPTEDRERSRREIPQPSVRPIMSGFPRRF